jgi:hypothetical protein
LIKQSYELVDKLNTLASSANRVRAFPELLAGEQQALSILNKISRSRLDLVRALDAEEDAELSGEIAKVRTERRALMTQIAGLPVDSNDFMVRDQQGSKQWNTVSQELTQQSFEVDKLNAVINGLRRMLKQDAQQGMLRDPATLKRFADELEANENDLKARQKEIAVLRKQIDLGRLQVGLGDSRFQKDASARARFRDLVELEVKFAAAGQAGSKASAFAQRAQGALPGARVVEDKATAAFLQLDKEVEKRIVELRGKVAAEQTKIAGYEQRLAVLDGEAKELVGKVAKRNLELVRDKIRNVVLRADVGLTEQAWEVREEELYRVRTLQTERARQEQALDDELREVLDDSGDKK